MYLKDFFKSQTKANYMYTDTHRLSNQKAVTRGNITYNIRTEYRINLNSKLGQKTKPKLCYV